MADEFRIEEWPVIFAEFIAAKEAATADLAKERAALAKAQAAYTEAVESSEAVAAYRAAKTRRMRFRVWATAHGFGLTDPRAGANVPGVQIRADGPTADVSVTYTEES